MPGQLPCCHSHSRGRISPCQRPGLPAAHKNDRYTIARRKVRRGAESSPQNRFALHHGGRIRTTPGRLRRRQDPAPPHGTMQKLPLRRGAGHDPGLEKIFDRSFKKAQNNCNSCQNDQRQCHGPVELDSCPRLPPAGRLNFACELCAGRGSSRIKIRRKE